jgi:hypothetical protein
MGNFATTSVSCIIIGWTVNIRRIHLPVDIYNLTTKKCNAILLSMWTIYNAILGDWDSWTMLDTTELTKVYFLKYIYNLPYPRKTWVNKKNRL